jgi:hypothetical protein
MAAVSLVGFLGSGAEDLTWAFQIGFVGSVFFGLLALEVLDGALLVKPSTLVVASLSLVASLMCSTAGDAMVVAAAVLAAARLPKKQALVMLAPPVGIYVLWFAFVGRLGLAAHSDRLTWAEVTGLPAYLWTGLSSALGTTFNLSTAGGALLVGLGAWVALHLRSLWARQPALLGLCLATLAFYVLVALGRDTSTVSPSVSRYVYIALVLLVPAIAKLLSPARASAGLRWGAVALLGFTTLGDIGQAETWTTARVTLTSDLKTEVLASAELLAGGVRDVSGPGAPPIGAFPNLTSGALLHLAQAHLVPPLRISAQALANARTALALGSWNGSVTALTLAPLFAGHFAYSRSTFSDISRPGHGCLLFVPDTTSPLQVWLRLPAGEASASLLVKAPPAAPGAIDYVAGVLVPPGGPSSSVPTELVVPARGLGYLSDNDPRAQLVVTWNVGTPLTLCGLTEPAHAP